MACASDKNIVFSFAHLYVAALQLDNKLHSSIHTIKQVMHTTV